MKHYSSDVAIHVFKADVSIFYSIYGISRHTKHHHINLNGITVEDTLLVGDKKNLTSAFYLFGYNRFSFVCPSSTAVKDRDKAGKLKDKKEARE